jgi:hypothetical protein
MKHETRGGVEYDVVGPDLAYQPLLGRLRTQRDLVPALASVIARLEGMVQSGRGREDELEQDRDHLASVAHTEEVRRRGAELKIDELQAAKPTTVVEALKFLRAVELDDPSIPDLIAPEVRRIIRRNDHVDSTQRDAAIQWFLESDRLAGSPRPGED